MNRFADEYEEIAANMPSEEERIGEHNEVLLDRLDYIMPGLLEEEDFDGWMVIGRENNEDPIISTLLPGSLYGASRITAFLFTKNNRFVLSPYGSQMSDYYESAWKVEDGDIFDSIGKLLMDLRVKTLGVDYSENFALADGITHSLFESLRKQLSGQVNLVSAENIAINWLQTRTDREIEIYRHLDRIANIIIRNAFSRENILSGMTTTRDVELILKRLASAIGLRTWFGPDVDFQRRGVENPRSTGVVEEGDLLHCDFGFIYNGLATDTQQMFYLKRKSRSSVPEGLQDVVSRTNEVQDILARNFIEGISGNELLRVTLKEAEERDLDATIYSHPIGYHGHGAGPIIGLWNNQEEIKGTGDLKIRNSTCFAMELNSRTPVTSWSGQPVYGFLEETVAFRNNEIDYLDGRQEELFLI
ncbi:MAG: M24 family metallopeptidase [Kosmotogaceae bacterium]